MRMNNFRNNMPFQSSPQFPRFGNRQTDLDQVYQAVSELGRDLAAAQKKWKGRRKSEKETGEIEEKLSLNAETEEMPEQSLEEERIGYSGLTDIAAAQKIETAARAKACGCPECDELSPEMLRKAILWSEILGEPAAKKRRRKRMMQNGN